MGFMDKVKAQATVLADKAQTGVQSGQSKIQEMQSGKNANHILREIGAYVFLSERGRQQPDTEAKVAALMAELDAVEAAGTPITVTPEPVAAPVAPAAPPVGEAPQAAYVPQAAPPAGAPMPPQAAPAPPDAAPQPPPSAPDPAAGSFIPQSGGAIPQPGPGLPGQ